MILSQHIKAINTHMKMTVKKMGKPFLNTCLMKTRTNNIVSTMDWITLTQTWRHIFKVWDKNDISSKKLFLFSRYSNFCIFVFPSFSPVSHCFRGWSKINLKVYDVINCLNKNLITHFVWYLEKEKRYDTEILSIDRVLNKEHFYGKTMQKMCTKR